MYIPKHFEQPRVKAMHELMRARPLATLVTPASGGLDANHIPLHLSDAPAPFGTLRGHVARANPLWRDFAKEIEALAIFHGPDAYITPSWYATKKEHGKVAPTWNYAVVHAHGTLCIVDDAAWVRAQIETLTAVHEASFPNPWAVSDAPREFTEKLIESVVGIEIVITRLSGKWKVSQNQPEQNRAGVIEGLQSCGHSNAAAMAALVEAGAKDVR
ncbi:MAG: FMN-binding negative transcriptional regulator [Gallionella sp.]|nr:FMN-binding negative transcriptional regulator [Gallionella sp.]